MKYNLRPWKKTDIDSLVKYADNNKIARYLTDAFPNPYTKADGEKFLAMFANENPTRVFAIEVNGEAVGSIGIFPQSDIHYKNAEMGYWLAEPFWGKGIMTDTIIQMIRYGFETFDIERIFARPFGSNIPSHRVLEKAGFKLEARFEQVLIKNGIWEDEYVFAVRNSKNIL